MYQVLELFADLQDHNHIYQPGDSFPREGLTVSPKRLAELAGKENKRKRPVIAEIKEETQSEEEQPAKKTTAAKRKSTAAKK